jgi:hypothetical protein
MVAIGSYVYTSLLFAAPSVWGWSAMAGLLLLQMVAYAAVTFLGSTLTRSPLAAAALGIAALTVIALVGALPAVGAWTPGGLAEAALVVGIDGRPEHVLEPVVATVAVITVALGTAWLAFRRQEL